MKIKKFDELLNNYNLKLNKISKTDIDYKIKINYAVLIFFKEINKLDKYYINNFLKNINKENIKKNEVHKEALNYLILLVIKNTRTKDLFVRFFPEYLETESVQKSNWAIVRWWNIIISLIFKPKVSLLNLIEARKLLNALKNIKSRVNNSENNLLLHVDSELENYSSLSFVVEKFFENKISSVVYNPISEVNLNDSWLVTFKNKIYLENNILRQTKSTLEIDTFLNYLNCRIKLLTNLEKKQLLLKEMAPLKAFVQQKEINLFNKKIDEMNQILKDKFVYQDTFKISGIYNLIEGIKQRFKLICKINNNTNLKNQQCLSPNFRDLFYFTIDKVQFFFEHYKQNLDKQTERCFVNGTNFYKVLNRLESFLYTNINLFDHTLNQISDNTFYLHLSFTLALLQQITKDLEDCTKDIDSKLLQADITQLSQFINKAISPLQIALNKIIEGCAIQNEFSETTEVYEEIKLDIISETLSHNTAQHSQDLGQSSQINLDNQSDSGISDDEGFNLSHNKLSNYPHTSFFKKIPINDVTTDNSDSTFQQQILVN